MKFSVQQENISQHKTPCLILFGNEESPLSAQAEILDQACNQQLSNIIKQGDFQGKSGQTLLLYQLDNISAERLLLVGLGKQDKITPQKFKDGITAASKILKNATIQQITVSHQVSITNKNNNWVIKNLIDGFESNQYDFTDCKSDDPDNEKNPLENCIFLIDDDASIVEQAIAEGTAISSGKNLAKTLSNLPGNICTPSYLAEQAQKLQDYKNIKVNILDEAEMTELKMGSLLSVSRGSQEPARLIAIEYTGTQTDSAPIVLVGKGLTFDAGGISLKPSLGMDEMKYDMCGGASVIGTLLACAKLQPKINVVGIVPSSENLPDGLANKPGDIVTSMAGKTIEILNTDAEGRLILCDALTYAARYNPKTIIDIATLTGACVIALGKHASGVLGNDDDLIQELINAGQQCDDRVWQLPLWDEYTKQLDSNFADIANIGGKEGGTITAACFLSLFTENYHWAHLDIAGTAWVSGKDKGATGRPVSLLMQYLLNNAE
ncbi:MAG: leucyl aminopeptidase [Methylococcales bacterium]|jgi:leucyl aminopeptidase|nr:leucyl aminopeptidase [Methylococcales bacterium]MBT7409577.1 leucyl aminopeptidase [Methylococcales bacterium]